MAIQTTYGLDPAVAFEGMRADSSLVQEVVSRNVGTGTIPAGRAVCRYTSDQTIKLPASSGDVALTQGVSLYDAGRAPGDFGAALPSGAQFLSPVPVLRKGRVWVKVEEAVVQGDPVFVRYASGSGGANLGAFRKSADTSTAAQLAGAMYATSASTNGFAQVELNLP